MKPTRPLSESKRAKSHNNSLLCTSPKGHTLTNQFSSNDSTSHLENYTTQKETAKQIKLNFDEIPQRRKKSKHMTLILNDLIEKEWKNMPIKRVESPKKETNNRHHRNKTDILSPLAQINQRLRPTSQYFSVRKLRSTTLLRSSKSPKGTMKFEINQNSPLARGSPIKFPQGKAKNQDDAIQLGTENILSKLYEQSIRLQKYLRQKDTPHILERKLKKLNDLIHKENSKLANSYFSL
ncbi:unnamed protein product [Blepharisma stoltei]|uniref:Uncharacterized protein n=1 Tax=Blepharisma stoltei TaxID=1481888 RepID=A0AAU9JZ89_9CILI|nr:unnamed protein product [Blepharisma stoltei]